MRNADGGRLIFWRPSPIQLGACMYCFVEAKRMSERMCRYFLGIALSTPLVTFILFYKVYFWILQNLRIYLQFVIWLYFNWKRK